MFSINTASIENLNIPEEVRLHVTFPKTKYLLENT